ncbi:MAG: site-specific DNA-methyltransferase, partial [Nanoarchaeota archaeon]|nr:site-specific DNA-methyltransferase [Nanoarchaeota archaeon]
KRDLTRPKQRPKHMISIRLARILINLSGAVEDSVLLDPFCGYGILLQEAMLMGLNVFGIDRSYECVNASEINIRWLKKKYNVKKDLKLYVVIVKN